MNRITIYSASGEILYEMPTIYKDCKEKVSLMSEDYIELHFSLLEPIFFGVGSWCVWNDKRYYITSHQQPTANITTGGYDYDLKFDAYYIAWKLRIYKSKVQNVKETKFNYTGNAKAHLQFFVEKLKEEGFLYNDEQEYTYDIEKYRNKEKDILENVKTLSFDGINFIDVLNKFASELDTEWWVRKEVIYLGKCEENEIESVDFELYKNVAEMSSSKSEQNYATRLYAFGGTQNLPHNWNKGDAEFEVASTKTSDKTFKTKQDIVSSYFSEKYIHKAYDYTTAIIQNTSVSVDTKNIINDKYVVVNAKTNNISLPHAIYKIVSDDSRRVYPTQDGNIQNKYSFSVRGSENEYKILGFVHIKYKITYNAKKKDGTYVNGTLVEQDKYQTFTILALYGSGIKISTDLNQFELKEDVSEFKLRVQIYNVIFTNRPDDTETNLYYKGNISVENNTDLRFRISDYYNEIDTKLAFLQEDGSEQNAKDAIFSTKPTYFNFRFKDKNSSIPTIGAKFHIKNILNSKLPSYYFPSNRQDTGIIKAMAETRLCLPEGYIQSDNKDTTIVEKVVTFEDIYPNIKAPITQIDKKQKDVLAEDGVTITGEKYTEYSILQSEYVYRNDYKLPDTETLQIVFQTGSLSGLTFDVEYNETTKWFKIKRKQFDGGLYLPSTAMHPEVGNEFILVGWDSSRIEELGLISEAQERLEKRAKNELENMTTEPSTYTCTMYSDVSYGIKPNAEITDEDGNTLIVNEDDINITDNDTVLNSSYALNFDLGQRVILKNKAFFQNGYRESRIIGYEKYMDIPYDSPQYEVGEKAIYSKLKDLQQQINNK